MIIFLHTLLFLNAQLSRIEQMPATRNNNAATYLLHATGVATLRLIILIKMNCNYPNRNESFPCAIFPVISVR